MRTIRNVLGQPAFFVILILYFVGLLIVVCSHSAFAGYTGGLLTGVTLGLITFLVQREYSRIDEERREARQAIREFLAAHANLSMAAVGDDEKEFKKALERACVTQDVIAMLSEGRLEQVVTKLRYTAKCLQHVHSIDGPALPETEAQWQREQRSARSELQRWLASLR